MHLQTINQTPQRQEYELKYNAQIRKTETMFLKLLSNFFWVKKQDNEHSFRQLSNHLKRDIGVIENDISPRMPSKNLVKQSVIRPSVWL